MENLTRHLIRIVFMLCAVAANSTTTACGQDINVTSIGAYQHVLDVLFPRDLGNFRDVRKEISIILRFTPSFAREMQFNITKYSDDRDVEAVMYTLPEGSKSIWEQVDAARQRNERESANKIAKTIRVDRQVINDKEKLKALLKQFAFLNLPSQLSTDTTLDGIRFELWYEARSNEYYYSLVGAEPGEDNQSHPIVKWMNEVRRSFYK